MIKSLSHWKAASWVPSLFGVSNDLLSKLNFIKWICLFIPWLIDIDSKRKYKITYQMKLLIFEGHWLWDYWYTSS
jgi:hypothetical protein